MIYRRENPTTPSKRHRSVILNPQGSPLQKNHFYITQQKTVGQHFGKHLCKRRRKSLYTTKFNHAHGLTLKHTNVLIMISLARRHKTFVGVTRYSNGALSCLPLFSGAYVGQVLTVVSFQENPKFSFFPNLWVGATTPLRYLPLTACIFNVLLYNRVGAFFSKAAGTFCIVSRINKARGYYTIKLPSIKFYKLSEFAVVMLGRNSNPLVRGL